MTLPMSVTIEPRAGYLLAQLAGFRSGRPFDEVLERVSGQLVALGLDRLLLDMRSLAGVVTPADHVAAAEQVLTPMQGIRCATLMNVEQYSGAGLARAREGGLEIRGFFDEAEAIAWLVG